MTDKEKILKYLEFKGVSKNKFYIKTGFSVGFLDSGSSLGVDKLKIIIDNYPDFNSDWLLTGQGSMIKNEYKESESQHSFVAEKKTSYNSSKTEQTSIDNYNYLLSELRKKDQLIQELKAEIELLKQSLTTRTGTDG